MESKNVKEGEKMEMMKGKQKEKIGDNENEKSINGYYDKGNEKRMMKMESEVREEDLESLKEKIKERVGGEIYQRWFGRMKMEDI